MAESWQQRAGRLSAESLVRADATGWFERLYAAGAAGEVGIPWDRTEPHPLLAEAVPAPAPGARAVVVGCGVGADAEHLAGLGYAVTGFDVAPTAIATARRRSTHPGVQYRVADLLSLPAQWARGFALVVEVYTVQALPDPPRPAAIAAISALVAPDGWLLVVMGARGDHEPPAADGPPWPISRAELDAFAADGLIAESVELLLSTGAPPWPHWRASFRRPQN